MMTTDLLTRPAAGKLTVTAKGRRWPPAKPWKGEIAHWLLTTFRITGGW